MKPLEFYEQRLKSIGEQQQKLRKEKNTWSVLRFISFVVALAVLWQLWSFGVFVALSAFISVLAVFIFFVLKDINTEEKIQQNKILLQINHDEIEILNHHFHDRPNGQEFQPHQHAYANDLDIFGAASIYQYINRTSSEQGNKLLASWLLGPAPRENIVARQASVKELAGKMALTHEFRVYNLANKMTSAAEQKIALWLQVPNNFLHKPLWQIARFIYPVISLTVLALFILSMIPSSVFYPLLLLFFIIAFSITKTIMPQYKLLNKIVPELEAFYRSVRWIETLQAETQLNKELKDNFKTGAGTASNSIRSLKGILERLDYRFNPLVFVPLNMFLLWDLQQVRSLEKWKAANNPNISRWFRSVSEMEVLISIGTLSFNHPDWCFPTIAEQAGVLKTEDLGHPLIQAEKRITNSFFVSGSEQLSLITGSNMAGKSTFLRSVGVALVMSMMGAPVCASRQTVSHMKVMSSMRISDNLEENTSTFYAELKKLKEIIDAVRNNEKMLVILDEMLRGTNSADRHAGSRALIRQLVQKNAMSLVATHDLELARLAVEIPGRISNYHFDVQVSGEELSFDYKLKDGICTSMNASLLMKKIGIELEAD